MRLISLILLLAGCAHGGMQLPGPLDTLGTAPELTEQAPQPNRRGRKTTSPRRGVLVAGAAGGFIGAGQLEVGGKRYNYDCSGLVAATYARVGLALSGSSADLFELARAQDVLHRRKRPQPGDVAFFDDTYDRNGNGRRDDPLSHVAVVESIDGDGTITMVHMGSKGVLRIRMNLVHPDMTRDDSGVVFNDYLRGPGKDKGPRLTGELWRAFGSFWALDSKKLSDGIAMR